MKVHVYINLKNNVTIFFKKSFRKMDSLLVYLYFCIRTDFLVLNQLRHKEEKISVQKMIKVKLIGYKLLKPCLSM